MISLKRCAATALLLAACSTNSGPAETPEVMDGRGGMNVADGQSGTEQGAGYACVLDEGTRAEPAPLDAPAPGVARSAAEIFAQFEGTHAFACGPVTSRALPPSDAENAARLAAADNVLEVTIERGNAARLLTGKLYDDTDVTRSEAPTDCSVLELDATVTVRFQGRQVMQATQLRVDHLGRTPSLEGLATLGEEAVEQDLYLAIMKDGSELFLRSAGLPAMDWCAALRTPDQP